MTAPKKVMLPGPASRSPFAVPDANSLRGATELLSAVVEAIPDPCVIVDSNLHVVAANHAWNYFARQNSVPHANVNPIGGSYLAWCKSSSNEDGVLEVKRGIESVLAGRRKQFEREYICPINETIHWYRKIVRPLQFAGPHAMIFHREITAEKVAQLNTQTLEHEFRALADSAAFMIWISGPDQKCTYFNKQWLDFTGVPLEEQLGEGWTKIVHPEDRDRVLQDYAVSFEANQEFELEYRLLHHDGSYRWIRDRGIPRFDSRMQIRGFFGSAWDITGQKQAIEAANRATRYTQLVNAVAEITNTATTMREALQRSLDLICETLELPVAHALLIQDDEPDLAKTSHIVYTKDMARFKELYEISTRMIWPQDLGTPGEVLRSGKPDFHDIAGKYLDPQKYPRGAACQQAGLQGSMHLPILVGDKVEAILEFGCDKTVEGDQDLFDAMVGASERLSRFFERRRAQINFQKQKEELQTSAERLFAVAGQLIDSQEEERRRIAGEIHDDFTQRLALVSLKISSLAGRDRGAATAELDADLEDVRKSISAVAGDLRDLSHQLHPATLELLGLTRAIRACCDEFQRVRGIETNFHIDASDDDASQPAALCLYRVLQESLMNIAKHAPHAKAQVSLTRSDDQLELRIRDDGPGFVMNELFHSGIGLMNMRERASLLDGKLIVRSNPGQGTEVTAQIPAMTRVHPNE